VRGDDGGDAALLVLLDDLQWADDGSLDFVEHLARSGADLPLLVLCAARPALFERRPGWGGCAARRIDLGALAGDQRDTLADALLARIDDPPAVLRELLVGGADGNPFYMEELTLMLIDDGVIVPGPLRWRVLPDKLLEAHVPTTLTGVLQARIDALPAAEKRALQQASVIGPLFWDDALAQLNSAAPQALPALDRRHLVLGHATSAFEHTREFAFNHHLLHQVTYDGLLKRHKREQHRITALWLEQRCAGRSGEYVSLLAEHFERAGVVERAVHYWTRAADDAARRCADAAALAHTDRALALDADPDAPTRFALINVREGVFARRFALEARAEAVAELERLAALSGDGLQRLQAAQRRAWLLFIRGAFAEAIETAQRGLAWAGSTPTGDAARIHNVLMGSMARLGRFAEALEHGLAGLAIARAAGDRNVQGYLHSNLGNTSMEGGDPGGAIAPYERAVAIFREIGDRSGLAGTLGNQATLLLTLGQPQRARVLIEENLRLCLEIGNRGAETSARATLAQALLTLGEPAAAREMAQAALGLARAIIDPFFEAQSLACLGDAHVALGEWPAARELLAAARDRCDAIEMRHKAMEPISGLARVALATGDRAGALDQVELILARQSAGTGWDGDFAVRLVCWRVLAGCGDARAAAILASACADLRARAERINDPLLHQSFLAEVPAHRDLLAALAAAAD
jgi:tetratricopeptide (TPR) repeat protein